MNRHASWAFALALASLTSVGCAASSSDEEGQGSDSQPSSETGETSEALQIGPGGGGGTSLTCHRFPTDTCISVGTYCRNHGGQLWCDLQGNCTCRYSVLAR